MINDGLELLAPAGAFPSLKAAVANGADAVYLGGGLFNARRSAGNFTDSELKDAFAYCRERGVKVYVTLNTLLKDSELDEALSFAAFAYENGAHAVIVQDLGLARLLKIHLPDLKRHASTQMTIHSLDGVRACEEMGFERVVLARELSLRQIGFITASCNAEIEVFTHGALCVSYSGQCLMSSFIGARSGNRGMCAQPCRLPWRYSADGEAFGKESYLLSPKDLMGLSALPELKKAGVKSLKIEGRMKSPEYVAVVTGLYRKYLDRLDSYGESDFKIDEADLERLHQIFNRGGFTTTYLKGDRKFSELMYPRHPKNRGVFLGKVIDALPDAVKVFLENDLEIGDGIEVWDEAKGNPDIIVTSIVDNGRHQRSAASGASPWIGDMKTKAAKGAMVWKTYSKLLITEAAQSYERGEVKRVAVDAEFSLKCGERASLVLRDKDDNRVEVLSIDVAVVAQEKPLTEERVSEQLQKTGDTPYRMDQITVHLDGISTMPVSAVNAMRREALSCLSEKRIQHGIRAVERSWQTAFKPEAGHCPVNKGLTVFFYERPFASDLFSEAVSRIYVPVMAADAIRAIREQYRGELYVWVPPILKDYQVEYLLDTLREIHGLVDGFAAGNPGVLRLLSRDFPSHGLHADAPINLFNTSAVAYLKHMGAQSATISPELNLGEAVGLRPDGMALEATLYGRVPLMTLEYCPGSLQGECNHRCRECVRRSGYMKDRKGAVFPYMRDPDIGITRIFNQVPIFMDDLSALSKSPLAHYRLSFLNESREEIEAVIQWFRARLKGEIPVDLKTAEVIAGLKEAGITKGHWFRGV
jgi:putative protease